MIKNFILVAISLFIPLILRLFLIFFSKTNISIIAPIIKRSQIIDADGVILATTIATKSVCIVPYEVFEHEEIAQELSKILNVTPEYIKFKLNVRSRKFAWIMRHVTPAQANAIVQLGFKGVYISKDSTRFYPQGPLFNNILGKVDDKGDGLQGVEAAFNEKIKENDEPLKLSLKTSIQFVVKDVLDKGKEKFSAKTVFCTIICAKTGRVLAMYSKSEDFEMNPHENYPLSKGNINLNTQFVFEFGSIMKVINAAMLMENKNIKLDDVFFAPKQMKLGRKYIVRDFRRDKDCDYTFTQAFVKSSNIVHGQLAYEVGLEKQLDFFDKCGFFEKVTIDLLQSAPSLYPNTWKPINGITITYGYGMAMTAVHFLQAMLKITSGIDKKLHILQDFETDEKELFSKEMILKLKILLREAAISSNYDSKYKVAGYDVGGKTGTANKIVDGKYANKKNICSYCFMFPYDNPKIIGIVVVDEPVPSKESFWFATAGWFATPLACEIVRKIGPMIN